MPQRPGEHAGPGTRVVPDAVLPPEGQPRFPLVDATRAIAALSILVFHAGLNSRFIQQGGEGRLVGRLDAGVAIFFVISAFLLYRPHVAGRLGGRRPTSVALYARRRFLRIAPAYWLALLVLGAVIPSVVEGVYGDRWWVYLGFLQTYDFDWVFGGIGAAWSLCVEVSFYVLLPAYAFLLGRLGTRLGKHARVRVDLAALAVLGLASLVTRGVVQSHPRGELSFSVLPQTIVCHFLWFALGMGLAVVSAATQHGGAGPWMHRATHAMRGHPNVLWASAALLLLAVSLDPGLPVSGNPRSTAGIMAVHVAYGLFALLVFIPAVMAETRGNLPRRVLSNRLLAWLGLVSYGIFLWHQPLSNELARRGAAEWLPGSALVSVTVATLAVAVACAAASYYLLERPVLRFKHTRRERHRAPRTAPAESTVAP